MRISLSSRKTIFRAQLSGRSDMAEQQDLGPAYDYFRDACQRSVLFLDVLRQRGNNYRDQLAKEVPHVLEFDTELILGGRSFARPVNYGLVRIKPPQGVT